MPSSDWPTEAMATAALEAVAREIYEKMPGDVPWEDLPANHKLPYKDALLAVVWGTIRALPDPRFEAWERGWAAGFQEADEKVTAVNPYF